MALDETMLILHSQNIIPDTVRIWGFKPTTLSIGRFLSVKDWVDEEELKRFNFPLIRRFTGGGPTLHDENGEITWTVVLHGEDLLSVYKMVSEALIKAISHFGLKASFSPINDITIDGKKVVGMAGAIKKKSILVHGTFMYATNLDFMKVIKSPKVKEEVRGEAKSRVATISSLLGYRVKKEEAIQALIEGFSSVFKLEEGSLTELEIELANSLKFKYTNEKWTYLR